MEENQFKAEISVYGKETCGVCQDAKKNFNQAIQENKLETVVKLSYFDIEKDPRALAKYTSFNTTAVPVIIFKDLTTGNSSKASGMAPSVQYITDYFKNHGYI